MKLFLDSADPIPLERIYKTGLIDGVTTNPSLVAATGQDYRSLIEAICEICPKPVSVEVLATDYEGMLREARAWQKVAPQIVAKIPLTPDGLAAVSQCRREGIPTNVTLCFQATQALLAAKAGANYVSPFIGRVDDMGYRGMDEIAHIRSIFDRYQFPTEILAASIRSPLHVKEAALAGAHIATLAPEIFEKLMGHPLTDRGLAQFIADARKIPPSFQA